MTVQNYSSVAHDGMLLSWSLLMICRGNSATQPMAGCKYSRCGSQRSHSSLKETVENLKGNCHCEAIKFELRTRSLDEQEMSTCSCSICSRNGYMEVFVAREELKHVRMLPRATTLARRKPNISFAPPAVVASSLILMGRSAQTSLPSTQVPCNIFPPPWDVITRLRHRKSECFRMWDVDLDLDQLKIKKVDGKSC